MKYLDYGPTEHEEMLTGCAAAHFGRVALIRVPPARHLSALRRPNVQTRARSLSGRPSYCRQTPNSRNGGSEVARAVVSALPARAMVARQPGGLHVRARHTPRQRNQVPAGSLDRAAHRAPADVRCDQPALVPDTTHPGTDAQVSRERGRVRVTPVEDTLPHTRTPLRHPLLTALLTTLLTKGQNGGSEVAPAI
jgi:hypothetical protein